MANESGVIPISDARRIAKERRCPVVVIFAIEEDTTRFTVTTYGKNKKLCRHAADLGRQFSKAIMQTDVAPSQEEPMDLPDEPTVFRPDATPSE